MSQARDGQINDQNLSPRLGGSIRSNVGWERGLGLARHWSCVESSVVL